MKKRNRTAVVLVIILASVSFWFIVNNHKGTIKETLRDFAVKDTASISKIFLADKKGQTVTLERKANSGWILNGKYEVRHDALQNLLVTIAKVDVREPIGKNSVDNIIKRLAAEAIRCEIYQHGKLTKAYYVGREDKDATGTYMILMDPETLETSAKPFVTYIPGFDGYLTTRYFTEEKGWRDRTVFRYNPNDIKKVRMEVPMKPDESYELTVNGNNDYEIRLLSNNHPLKGVDTFSVKQYLSYFQQINYESFEVTESQKQIDSTLKEHPINILTVTNSKGETNKVTFFTRLARHPGLKDDNGNLVIFDTDRMDALMNNGKDFVMVQYFVFGKLLPPVDYFLKNTKQALPATEKSLKRIKPN
jgi:hypothetical protein